MKKFLLGAPLIASLLCVNFAYCEIDIDQLDEEVVNRSYNNMKSNDAPQTQQNMNRQQSSCCFESRCGCETYKRCCYPLPLPALCGWFFAEGEYLYLKAYTLWPYVATANVVPPFDLPGGIPYSRDFQVGHLSADSGYRVSLGAYFGNCSYGVARYTQFNSDGTDSFVFQPVENNTVEALRQQLNPLWAIFDIAFPSSNPIATNLLGNINAKQRYRQKFLDFDFYRSFSCSRFAFNPFVGVRFGWIKNDLRVDYILNADVLGTTPLTNTIHLDVSNHVNLGVGLHTGIDTNLDLCWGFGLYGTSSFAVLVGKRSFRVRQDMTVHATTTPFAATAATLTESYKETDFQPVWQGGIGLNWGGHFCRCSYYLGLKLGYELFYLPNSLSIISLLSASPDLINESIRWQFWERSSFVHGLTAGLRFDF